MSRSGSVGGPVTKAASGGSLVLLVAFSTLAAALMIALSGPVSAHRYPGQAPSLGAGQQFVYQCFSDRYCDDYATAKGTWNARPGNPEFVRVGPGPENTSATGVRVTADVFKENSTLLALWDAGPSPDEIWNNVPRMVDNARVYGGTRTHRLVATHEFGHAAGLHHPNEIEPGKNWPCRSIMHGYLDEAMNCGQNGYLLDHDKDDWVLLWGTG